MPCPNASSGHAHRSGCRPRQTPGQQRAYVFAPHPPAAAFALQLLDRVAACVQCSGHFAMALAVLEVRQRDQAQSPASIGFLAGQSVEILGLQLINDVLR